MVNLEVRPLSCHAKIGGDGSFSEDTVKRSAFCRMFIRSFDKVVPSASAAQTSNTPQRSDKLEPKTNHHGTTG